MNQFLCPFLPDFHKATPFHIVSQMARRSMMMKIVGVISICRRLMLFYGLACDADCG